MNYLHIIAFIVLVIGGLNWLAVGAFNTDLVMWLFGSSMLTKAVYILVGLAAIYEAITYKKNFRSNGSSMGGGASM